MTGKRLELLSTIVPNARLVAVLKNPSNPFSEPTDGDAECGTGLGHGATDRGGANARGGQSCILGDDEPASGSTSDRPRHTVLPSAQPDCRARHKAVDPDEIDRRCAVLVDKVLNGTTARPG